MPAGPDRKVTYHPGVVTCAFCGQVAEGDEPPITWTSAVEQGTLRHFCDRCSREHLRSMESKLDSEWW
jgi:hypothetical protein